MFENIGTADAVSIYLTDPEFQRVAKIQWNAAGFFLLLLLAYHFRQFHRRCGNRLSGHMCRYPRYGWSSLYAV